MTIKIISKDNEIFLSGTISLSVKKLVENNNINAFYKQVIRLFNSNSLLDGSVDYIKNFLQLFSESKPLAMQYIRSIESIVFRISDYISEVGELKFVKQCKVLLKCQCLSLDEREKVKQFINSYPMNKFTSLDWNSVENALNPKVYYTPSGVAKELEISRQEALRVLEIYTDKFRKPLFNSENGEEYYTLASHKKSLREFLEEIRFAIRVIF